VVQDEERSPSSSAFGILLRRYRLGAGLSQEALAERARMSVNGISALERGARRSPQRETLELLARALELDPERRRAFEVAAHAGSSRMHGTAASGPTNLPVALTSFVGRDVELTEIAELVRSHRLVTLTGTGGVGKTRTALRIASELREDSGDGVWFVELDPIADPALCAPAIAKVLGIQEAPNRPLVETLLAALKAKNLWIVLDNCEHVVAEIANLANGLLRACPGLRILATSREALRISGERVYRLPSLGVSGAIELFAERARAADRRFALDDEQTAIVGEICRRLDGLPLAIELAAARVNVLTPAVLSKKLEERFRILSGGDRSALPRQKTLRALIDWSYDLLTQDERRLLRRLSVFSGSWTFEAATTVCSDERSDPAAVFDQLAALLEKSLVDVEFNSDGLRYRLLESTREYAREQLASHEGPERIAREHARYYAGYVRTSRALWDAMNDRAWQRSLVAELDNLRAALEWTLGAGRDRELGVWILSEIIAPELVLNQHESGHWYELGSRAAKELEDRHLRAAFRRRYAATQIVSRAIPEIRIEVCAAAVAEARDLADPIALGESLKALGLSYYDAGRFEEANVAFEEASGVVDPQRYAALTTALTCAWAINDLRRGDFESARRKFHQARALARPDSAVYANVMLNLGELEFAAGRAEEACVCARSAVAGYRDIGMALYCGVASLNLAAYAMTLDRRHETRESLVEALDMLRESDSPYYVTAALECHGIYAATLGEVDTAARLLGYSRARDKELGRVRETAEERGVSYAIARLRERLGVELDRLLDEGSALSEAEALAYALAVQNTVRVTT
jgi:predicted ATPase/Flp pilus assembly protein TadD/DNA-binding XRE family transcriptional regulator